MNFATFQLRFLAGLIEACRGATAVESRITKQIAKANNFAEPENLMHFVFRVLPMSISAYEHRLSMFDTF